MQVKQLAWRAILLTSLLTVLSGCFSFKRHGDLATTNYVSIKEILGTYYVLGAMTTPLDRNPSDAAFEFTQQRDGSLKIDYSFRPKGPDSKIKTYTGRARIDEIESNADWSIRFIWPFENDYRVIYASDDQSIMMIGHRTRNYLYVLSRSPEIDYESLQWLLDFAASRGFDTSYYRTVPQF
jgi:apolipoprotein D and lipocalin family protein